MKTLIYPKNKKHFIKLMKFCKEIIEICKEINIIPIIYGSLAFFAYTKNDRMNINDIDLLIKEKDFKIIIKALDKNKIKYNYPKKWHTLIISKGRVKVEMDSIDYFQNDLPKNFVEIDFNGLVLKSVSLNTLKKIYKKASIVSKDNPEGNREKYELLKRLK